MLLEICQTMSNSTKIIIIESIAIILLCLFLFKACQTDSQPTTRKTKIEKEYKYYPKYYPLKLEHYTKGDSIKVPIPAVVDTASIIRNYFMQYTFTDSIRDTNIAISSQVQIALNRVLKSDIKYKLLRPSVSTTVTIENNTETKPRPALLLGADVGFSNKKQFTQFSPSFLFITKNKKAFGAGYDVLNQTYQAKIYLPIFK